MKIAGVLLAGGLARRMGGGDKPLRTIAGRPLLELVIERIRPQVSALVLNANGDPARFAAYGLPVVGDSVAENPGPLAGVLAGLDWAAEQWADCPMVVSVPTDAPFLPADLVTRLEAQMVAEGADLACAASGGRAHPVVGLWPVRLRHDLRRALVDEGVRKVDVWTARYRLATVSFSGRVPGPGPGIDPFFNANRPEDLDRAASLLASCASPQPCGGRG
jgi:molybdopterin-guanine dinucleotide biosynthesis protein A